MNTDAALRFMEDNKDIVQERMAILESHHEREGHYPTRIAVDGKYQLVCECGIWKFNQED